MVDVFAEPQRRELAGRARTLHERLDGPANVVETDPPVAPDRILEAWRARFPDEATFQDRLEREGLTTDAIREAIEATRWPPDEPLPDWIPTVEALVHHVETVEIDGGVDDHVPEGTPFREILAAIATYARRRLLERDVPGDAASPLVTRLVQRLERLCTRPLYVEFRSFVEHHDEELARADPDAFDDPPAEYYRSFVDSMLEHGFRNLCLEYPVLARQLVHLIEFWVDAVVETCRRIEDDRPALREEFGVEGDVSALTPLDGDPHGRGRFPIRVSFDEGEVVYKPRSVEAGNAFYTILEELDQHLSTPPVRRPQYVSRDGYGWMEPVAYDDLPDADAARRYYRRAGVLLCLAYALNLVDCQTDNVIARGDQPTVVDCETLFHPYFAPGEAGDVYPDPTRIFVNRTPLLTGLLPFKTGRFDGRDEDTLSLATLAGLGSESDGTEFSDRSVPSYRAVNTDVMRVVESRPVVEKRTNTPSVDDEDCPPADHVDVLVEAFEETHEAIRDLHADGDLFASIAVPELVEDVENRLVLRGTEEYDSVLTSACGRDPLRDGVRLSVEFEELVSPLFTDSRVDASRWLPVYAAERAALGRRDVPRFTSRTDRRAVFHDGTSLDIELESSGIARAKARLDRIDAADQSRQASLVRRCFEPVGPSTETPPPSATAVPDDRLRREAIDLFEDVLEAGIETPEGKKWVSPASTAPMYLVRATAPLYYGKCGVALAGAALYDATGRDRYRRLVDDLLDRIVEEATTNGPTGELGGIRGTGSVVYSLSVVPDVLGEDTYRDGTLDVTRLVTADRLAGDDAFDVMTGTAGALLGLLAFHERYGESEVLGRAIDCGERLLDARESVDGYGVWKTVGDRPTTGFAHGQSGIAYSLARLAAATDDRRYARAAREALAFESNRSGPTGRSDAHRAGGDREPEWCRGLAGHTLARVGIGDCLGDEAILEAAREDLAALAGTDPHPFDNLCCGNLGRAEALLAGTRRLGGESARPDELVGQCLARRERDGALALPGHSRAVPNVSFLDGISGAAYALLRHERPDAYPCVLLLE